MVMELRNSTTNTEQTQDEIVKDAENICDILDEKEGTETSTKITVEAI